MSHVVAAIAIVIVGQLVDFADKANRMERTTIELAVHSLIAVVAVDFDFERAVGSWAVDLAIFGNGERVLILASFGIAERIAEFAVVRMRDFWELVAFDNDGHEVRVEFPA
jgi:hypothetical protein